MTVKLGTYTLMTKPGTDPKTVHGQDIGLLTGILYLAPSDISDRINVCKHASVGCRAACLFYAGKGGTSPVKARRIARTLLLADNKQEFWSQLVRDIQTLIFDAGRNGLIPVIRLNGTSDLPWERMKVHFKIGAIEVNAPNIMALFPTVVFYDYTAYPYDERPDLPSNYELTFSRKETTTNEQIAYELSKGRNVAVPFSTINSRDPITKEHRHSLPATFLGIPVINGDLNDARFADPKGVIVGLRAKGDARKDKSGFVVDETSNDCGWGFTLAA